MLGTNGKMKNNLLLGTKFDTILEHIFLVGAKRKECLFIIIVVKMVFPIVSIKSFTWQRCLFLFFMNSSKI
jgi:hypothetical protein